MKIDRRSFLSFVIGGAAGTALTPLPWKLTDDISIWSQMWPWTPVPEKGEVSVVKSACTLCPGGCGISVRKVDNRVVKIEGLEGHPVNDGSLCTLGLAGAQLLYGPRRIKTPLKKVTGRFVEISWEDALAEVTEKLAELRTKGETHTVACISSSDRGTVAELLDRFLRVYGSRNFIRMPSSQDAYEVALYLTQGVRAMPGFDVQRSDFVLSFGSGLLDGWGSPVYLFDAHSQWRDQGGKLIQVEPRLSRTAAKADQWVPVNPGTEGALALGLAAVIIKESLQDETFVSSHSSGFQEWKRLVLDGFGPDIVSKITGVQTSVITDLARRFARAKRPLATCGRGKGTSPGSLKEVLAVHFLNALVGNLGREGGFRAVPEPEYIEWPELEMDQAASIGTQQARIDGAGSNLYSHARYLANRLPEALLADPGYQPLQVLFISEANPAYSLPGTAAFEDAVAKIPMKVSFSSYMDETAELADLVLPNHTYLERYEDIPAPFGYPLPIISITRPVTEPQLNTMHTGDVVLKLAKALGGSISEAFPWESYEDCLEQTLGDRWDTLMEEGYWVDSGYEPPQWPEAFETASEKFEFNNREISALGTYSLVKPEGDEASFPLVLIPFDTMRLWSGYVGSPPFLMKSVGDTVLQKNDVLVEINAATAASLGLKSGSRAVLTTPKGKARVIIRTTEGIMPGLIALPRGLGHTANDRFLAGKGVNYNRLAGSVEDGATGHDAAWGIRARLAKA
jgi:anaerobic selenocysteine-containing dehydrogenase